LKTVHGVIVGAKFILRYIQNLLGLYRPYFAQWEVLYRCNMKCVFCNVYKDKTYDQTELSTQNSFKLLEELKRVGIIFINFTGGEVFLKKDFVAILRYARKLGFFITMNENGLLLKQYAPLIKDYVDSIHVSLDSDNSEKYEKMRGVENAFSKVLEGIRASKAQGIHVGVNLTVTKENFGELREFCEFMKDLDVDIFLTIVSVTPTEFKDTSQAKDLKVDFKQYAQKVKKLKREYPFIKTSDSYLDFVENGGFNNYRCLTMKTTLNIKPDGSIAFPCGYFPKFKFQGDVNKIKQWPLFQEAKKVFKYDFCLNCNLSCFYVPTALMDIKCWGPMLRSYLLAGLRRKSFSHKPIKLDIQENALH
jgi:MoaA/NifB/PqqE/SkfB family radical SAM enzyme